MGQYYVPVNLRKKEFLYSHAFGDGLKLLEFGCSAYGMMTGLALLLADGNGRGDGDLLHEVKLPHTKNKPDNWKPQPWERVEHEFQVGGQDYRVVVPEIVGRWAGDPIVIAGDYADEGKFVANNLPPNAADMNLYAACFDPACGFKDISLDVLWAMWDDGSIRSEYTAKDPHSNDDATRELMNLKRTPAEYWPLLIGKFKTDAVKDFFERSLRSMSHE